MPAAPAGSSTRPGSGLGAVSASPSSSDRSTKSQGAGAPAAAADRKQLASATWGSGPGQLGRSIPQEGNPQAPSSFAVAPDRSLVVLDQVNSRLVRIGPDGQVRSTTPLSQQVPQDLAVGRDGSAAILDRLKDRSVTLLRPDGSVAGELPIVGANLSEAGAATGVFVDGDSVYVEKEHSALVRVGDTSGKPDPDQPTVPGRPSRDGTLYLNAGTIDPPAGRLYVNAIARPSLEHRYTRELRLGAPLLSLVLLDTDLRGNIYLGALLEPKEGQPLVAHVICMSEQTGAPWGTADVPANGGPEETFRELTVLDEGGLIYVARDEVGISYQRAECR